jgi:hypothetical protein
MCKYIQDLSFKWGPMYDYNILPIFSFVTKALAEAKDKMEHAQ